MAERTHNNIGIINNVYGVKRIRFQCRKDIPFRTNEQTGDSKNVYVRKHTEGEG